MIEIKYTKNLLDKDAIETLCVDGDGLLLSEVKVLLAGRVDLEGLVFVRDGIILGNMNYVYKNEDIAAFYWLDDFGFTIGATYISGSWLAVAAVAATVYSVYMAVVAATASRPSYDTTNNGLDSTPTYGWDGIRTTCDVGTPIPIVYGEHKVGGNMINAYISNDGDKNYMNVLLALCEGEIESISDIKVNDQPIANFSGITTYADRLGTNADTVIPNFEDLFDNYTIAQSLNTLNASYTYTTQGTAVEGYEVQLSGPNGIYEQGTDGSLKSWSVGIKIEHKLHTDTLWTTAFDTAISGQQQTDIKRYFRQNGLVAGQYDIKITRTTEATSTFKMGNMTLAYIVEIRTDDLAYPNVAKLGIKALATDQISGSTPQVTCIVKGTKVLVPQVMNGATEVAWEDYYWDPDAGEFQLFSDGTSLTWDGATYVSRWSANPVWCLRDLCINVRYGMGGHIDATNIPVALWLPLAQYCEERVSDGRGGYEKRFRMDVVLDSGSRAPDVMLQLMSCFRGISFFSENSIILNIDRPDVPCQLFGAGNTIAGSLSQSIKSLRDVYNVIEVQYLDRDQDYKQNVITVQDEAAIAAGAPIRKNSIRLYTTRTSQALREARYNLLVSQNINKSISFNAGIDAIRCQAGKIISVSSDFTQWGFSGSVRAESTTTKVKLDRSVTLESGKTYKIDVRFADDTIEERTISTVPGTYSEVDVSVAFTNAPEAYDKYALGESNKVKKDFRIASFKRKNDLECEIQAAEYNEGVYDATAIVLPTFNSSALSLDVPSVESLKLTERLVSLADGTIESTIDIWFRRPDLNSIYVMYKKARIYISDNGGLSWSQVGETTSDHLQIIGGLIDGTEYKIAVVSMSDVASNSLANAPTASITLVGKSAAPDNVTGFLLNQSRDRLKFSWLKNTDVDLAGYEIRRGISWESGEVVAAQLKTTNFTDFNIREGASQSYWIKAVDTSGNYSTTATEAIVTIDNVPFTNIVQSFSEETAWAETKTNLSKVGDNLEIDSGYLTGNYVTAVKDLGYVATGKIGVNAVVVDATSGDATWDQEPDGATWDQLPDTERWSGSEIVGAVGIRIRTSEDNSTWSDWTTWQAGDYKCRYYQLEITLTRADVSTTLQLTSATHIVDLPDVDENQDGTVSVAADGCAVTFVKTFHEDPALNVTILSGTGAYWKPTSLDTTGVTIKLYDTSGTAVTGTFRCHVHGV